MYVSIVFNIYLSSVCQHRLSVFVFPEVCQHSLSIFVFPEVCQHRLSILSLQRYVSIVCQYLSLQRYVSIVCQYLSLLRYVSIVCQYLSLQRYVSIVCQYLSLQRYVSIVCQYLYRQRYVSIVCLLVFLALSLPPSLASFPPSSFFLSPVSSGNLLDPIRIRFSSCSRNRWPESGLMVLCTAACFRTRSFWPERDQVIQNQIGSEPVLHSMIRTSFGRMEPNRMREIGPGIYDAARFWLHAGRDGLRWP